MGYAAQGALERSAPGTEPSWAPPGQGAWAFPPCPPAVQMRCSDNTCQSEPSGKELPPERLRRVAPALRPGSGQKQPDRRSPVRSENKHRTGPFPRFVSFGETRELASTSHSNICSHPLLRRHLRHFPSASAGVCPGRKAGIFNALFNQMAALASAFFRAKGRKRTFEGRGPQQGPEDREVSRLRAPHSLSTFQSVLSLITYLTPKYKCSSVVFLNSTVSTSLLVTFLSFPNIV